MPITGRQNRGSNTDEDKNFHGNIQKKRNEKNIMCPHVWRNRLRSGLVILMSLVRAHGSPQDIYVMYR